MAEERVITIRMKLDAEDTAEELDKIEDGLENVGKSVEEIERDAKKLTLSNKLAEINEQVKTGELNFSELRAAVDQYKDVAIQAGRESPIGKQALDDAALLQKKLDELDREIMNLATNATNMQAAMQLGQGVLAGFTAFKSLTVALGVENENLMKTMVQLQAASAALISVEQIRLVLEKESFLMIKARALGTKLLEIATGRLTLSTVVLTAAQSVWSKVTKTATTVQAVFNAVLNKNPITLIVLAVIALTAAIVKFGKPMLEFMSSWEGIRTILLSLIGPIGWVILAYEKLFGEKAKSIEQIKEEIKFLEKLKTRHKEVSDERLKTMDLELARANALRKDTVRMQRERIIASVKVARRELEISEKLFKKQAELREAEATKRGETQSEYLQTLRDDGVEIDKILKDEKKSRKELNDAIFSFQTDLIIFEKQNLDAISKRQKEAEDKRKNESDKRRDESKKRLEARNAAIIKALDREIELRKAHGEDTEQLERERFETQISLTKKNSEKQKDLINKAAIFEANIIRESEAAKKKLKEAQDELDKSLREERAKDILAAEEKLSKLLRDSGLEEIELKINQLKDQHLSELKVITGNSEVEKQLRIELEKALLIDIAKIREEFREQEQEERIQLAFDIANEAANALSEIFAIMDEVGERRKQIIQDQMDQELSVLSDRKMAESAILMNAQKNELSNEKLTAEQRKRIQEKQAINKAKLDNKFARIEFNTKKKAAEASDVIAKRQFNRNKALRLVEIAINTAAATVQALAAFPPPASFVVAGATAALGAAQAAIVASQRFRGTAGSIQAPTFTEPTIDTGGGSSSGVGGGIPESGGPQEDVITELPTNVIVSQVEINKAQNSLAGIVEVATI